MAQQYPPPGAGQPHPQLPPAYGPPPNPPPFGQLQYPGSYPPPDPLGVPPQGDRKRRRIGIILGSIGVGLVAIITASYLLSELGATGKRPIPKSTGPITNSPKMSADGKTLTTDCYSITFTMSYELEPNAQGCQVRVWSPQNKDALFAYIDIVALSTGDDTLSTAERKLRAKVGSIGGTIQSAERLTIGGLSAVRFHYTDQDGKKWQHAYVIEHYPHWRSASGQLIDAFTIGGADLPQMDAVISSIKFT